MKEIQEYRKASAEALGYKTRNHYYSNESRATYHKYPEPAPVCDVEDWQPNKKANQMLMVWELMKNNMTGTSILYEMIKEWLYAPNSDIKLATMKAFMEYIKTK